MSVIVKADGKLATREHAPVTSLLEVISRAASDPAVDMDKMERLMQMHERMQETAAKKAFNDAMAVAQAEMEPISRNASNPQTRSKYASYDKLDAEARPIYTKHGFSISYDTGESKKPEHVLILAYVTLGAYERTYRVDMPADGKGAKGGDVMTKTHAAVAAVSYGKRTLLKAIFNLAEGEGDRDGNGSGDSETISEEQVANIKALLTELGKDQKAFLKWAKVDSLDQIVVGAYSETIKTLEAMRR
jgi:hypothetical protein